MTCKDCNFYRVTADGPYCYNGRIRPTSPIAQKDCFVPVQEREPIATKVCKRCGQELPISEFGKHHKTKDGYQPVCRSCRSKEMKGVSQKEVKDRAKEKTEFTFVPDMPTMLEQYTDDQLIEELRKRGWSGRITQTKEW